jgi:hypothetical protein
MEPPVAPERMAEDWTASGATMENVDPTAQPMPEIKFDQSGNR